MTATLRSLTEPLLQILWHTLGIDPSVRRPPYRNYYAHAPESADTGALIAELVADGLMERGRDIPGGLVYYHVTEAGRAAAFAHLPSPERPTRAQRRYRQWLQQDGGRPFGEWLATKGYARKEKS